jgi:hypothetical protein
MATPLDTLNSLADSIPVMNERARKQAEAARTVALQRSLGAAPAAAIPNTTRAAQEVAPQQVEAAGQATLAANQQTNQALQQVGQLALGVQQNQQRTSLARTEMVDRTALAAKEKQLAALGQDIQNKVLDSRLKFDSDELGRRFSNERQLWDWTIANAKSQEEFADRAQKMEQAAERKIQLLKTSHARISDALEKDFAGKEAKLTFEQRKRLLETKQALERKLAREKARARNRSMIFQGAGMLAGAAIGTAAGNPWVGAAMGAQIGGGVGTLAGGIANS